MSYTLFEEKETGRQFLWKDCEVPRCPNQVCHGRSDRFCFPHSKGDLSFKELLELGKELETT